MKAWKFTIVGYGDSSDEAWDYILEHEFSGEPERCEEEDTEDED